MRFNGAIAQSVRLDCAPGRRGGDPACRLRRCAASDRRGEFVRNAGRRFAALDVALTLVLACSGEPDPRPSFVFVLVDTLRRDHVGSYGYARDTTPTLDALAREGSAFDAVSQSSWTAPSMASLWSSRLPSGTGLHSNEDESGLRNLKQRQPTRMASAHVTLAEALGRAGYVTLAATTNVYASDKFGLLRGFDVASNKSRDAQGLVDHGLALVDRIPFWRRERPFLLYLHFIDLHAPTDPPPPYDSRFPTSDGAPHEKRHQRWSFGSASDASGPDFERFREHKLALYDGALAFVDAQLARLRAELAERGIANPVWVIASDHGEEFWDHSDFVRQRAELPQNSVGHGHSMFREILDVPLILSGPGVPRLPSRRSARNLDVAPSVLGLAGIDPATHGFVGVDLFAESLRGAEPLPALSEDIHRGYEAKAYSDARHRYIRYTGLPGQPELLFEREADPKQERDVAAAQTQTLQRLRAELDAALAGGAISGGEPVQLDAEDAERLRGLGYLE